MRILNPIGIGTTGTVANGGTGISSYTIGDMIYASGATTLSRLADVATGSVLVSGGVGTAPAYSAAPTIGTSVTTPILYGGSGAGSDLAINATSNGSPSGANVIIQESAGVNTGLVGIGQASPDGNFHVWKASAGSVTASANGNLGVFEDNASNGLSILVPDASTGNIFFGSATSNRGAEVTWTYNSNLMVLGTRKAGGTLSFMTANATPAITVDATAQTAIGPSAPAPDGQLHVWVASAGSVTASANGNIAVLESNGSNGLSILVPDASSANIFLGSASSNRGAEITYNRSGATMHVGTRYASTGILTLMSGGAVDGMYMDPTQNVMIGPAAIAPTLHQLSLSGQAAKSFGMERHTTANTAGTSLTIQAGGATSGATDKAGGQLLLKPGASTGTGRSSIRLQTYDTALATGTSDNTAIDAGYYGTTILTNNSATTIASFTLAADTAVAAIIEYAVTAVDTTNHKVQVETGSVAVICGSNNAVQAGNTATKYGNIQYVGANALTVTWAISAANPAVVSLNANSTLTNLDTGYPKCRFHITYLTNQAVTYA